jgi:outer membrane protein
MKALAVFAICAAFLWTGAAGAARAEEGAPATPEKAAAQKPLREVTLTEAVSTALAESPRLRAARSGLGATRQGEGIARSRLLPRVTLEERFSRTDNPTMAFMAKLNQERFESRDFAVDRLNNPSGINDFQTSVSLEQPLFAPEAYVGMKMARTQSAAEALELEREKEAVTLAVVRSYLSVVSAREMVQAGEKGLQNAREHRRVAQAAYKAGLALYSDTLRTEVAVKQAEETLISARKSLSVAQRALGLAMGHREPVDAREARELKTRPLDEYLQAVRERADIQAMERRVSNARNGVRLTTARFLPTVGVGARYQLNDDDTPFGSDGDSYQVGAFLRWTAFEGALRIHQRAQAKHRLEEARERLEGMRMEAEFRVHEAYLSVQEARRSLALARARRELARENLRLVEARYGNALATVVDLLDAQAALDEARAGVVRMKNMYLQAEAELTFRSGLLLEAF